AASSPGETQACQEIAAVDPAEVRWRCPCHLCEDGPESSDPIVELEKRGAIRRRAAVEAGRCASGVAPQRKGPAVWLRSQGRNRRRDQRQAVLAQTERPRDR